MGREGGGGGRRIALGDLNRHMQHLTNPLPVCMYTGHSHTCMYMYTQTSYTYMHLHQLVKSALISIGYHCGENSRPQIRGQYLTTIYSGSLGPEFLSLIKEVSVTQGFTCARA